MTIKEYIKELNKQYNTGSATEHSYRPALKSLLEQILPSSIIVINEPKRSVCGAPDYILTKDNIPVAFLEAKDFTKSNDLSGRKENKQQFDRYKKSLDHIIFTDYLDFWLYQGEEFVENIRIAEVKGNKIVAIDDSEAKFISLINNLSESKPQKITSSSRLATIMAEKARLLADIICKAIIQDKEGYIESELICQMNAFREVLISDLNPTKFADIYAQTIVYGMFAARLHDPTPENFSRQEASTLIPKTNPFLRQIFQNIAGYDLDERIAWIVDDLASVFSVTDVAKVMKKYGTRTRQTDPIIHFYENFLSVYDPALRKSCGVWYTPQPVVSYIVGAVDEILQKDFNLPMGLADTTKIKIETESDYNIDKRFKGGKKTYSKEYHKVQILDPATGTGTFLAEVVQRIYKKYKHQQGMWQSYVEEHLLPRINGFEILMASYAMAHLKLDMLLHETGYIPKNNERLKIYLTNSLEEHHPDTGRLFVQALANEANQANHLKKDAPVMVVMGNPPYSGDSKNCGSWIDNLMKNYKNEPNTFSRLKERNYKLVNNDYCKFIRLGQSFVERNQDGILAYINSNSFLDGIVFRGMRWNLMQSFDKIYIIDLHGNSKKNESQSNSSKDENVFDITEGVSINIFIKNGEKKKSELADVYHLDLFGKRKVKYDFLSSHKLYDDTSFQKIYPNKPFYFFVPKNENNKEEYEQGISIKELFHITSSGIKTSNDKLLINFNSKDLKQNLETNNIYTNDLHIKNIDYRPFDKRKIYYDTSIIDRPRHKLMMQFIEHSNLGLCMCRQFKSGNNYQHTFITDKMIDLCYVSNKTSENNYVFPLYLYKTDNLMETEEVERIPNLKVEIVNEFAKRIGLTFEKEKSGDIDKFAPIDLFDYIYGVLYSPKYRERYKEFLKVDFPRIPYPKDAEQMFKIAEIGGKLRGIHLMEDLPQITTTYPLGGDNIIGTITSKPSSIEKDDNLLDIYINDTQYFKNVPITAWNHYIGGYQPAQKWLKDRKGKKLTFDDIMHYQRIISALVRTTELMNQL